MVRNIFKFCKFNIRYYRSNNHPEEFKTINAFVEEDIVDSQQRKFIINEAEKYVVEKLIFLKQCY